MSRIPQLYSEPISHSDRTPHHCLNVQHCLKLVYLSARPELFTQYFCVILNVLALLLRQLVKYKLTHGGAFFSYAVRAFKIKLLPHINQMKHLLLPVKYDINLDK